MQQLWRARVGWDDPIPSTILTQWKDIYSQFSRLTQIQLPRWTAFGEDNQNAELHGFADASNVAYAAVVYLKIISNTGQITITLLAAKSRVAPLAPLTIPRLELSAAVLLARLIEHVRVCIYICVC